MTMNTPSIYRQFYRRARHDAMVAHNLYEADVNEWYSEGDGRPTSEGGRGYRYPTCEHGMSLWVDHDCACWMCEDSRTWKDEAMATARENFRNFCEVYDWMMAMPLRLRGTDVHRPVQDEMLRLWNAGTMS